MFEKVGYEKWTGRKIFHWLKYDIHFKARSGNTGLTLSNVYLILQNLIYYGVFEYPRKSGNFYTGRHEPIINKELFELVQEQVKNHSLRNQESFTKMIICGLCGSGICADEKFKKLKDGSVNRHVYYGCSKSKDKNYKCEYIYQELYKVYFKTRNRC